jgi:hypothetical protein
MRRLRQVLGACMKGYEKSEGLRKGYNIQNRRRDTKASPVSSNTAHTKAAGLPRRAELRYSDIQLRKGDRNIDAQPPLPQWGTSRK